MIKNILFASIAVLFLLACTKTISGDQYVGAMSALGCKSAMEGTPEAAQILKDQGITSDDIQRFRKKMDPKKAMATAQEIAKRVAECHGVK